VILGEEREKLQEAGADPERLGAAAELLDSLMSAEEFPEFLTLAAYQRL
jgi:hypothetical protein